MKMIPVILHYADYRGDHAADACRILRLPAETPLSRLVEIVSEWTGHGAAHIEVTLITTEPSEQGENDG